jgi:hypothetical protein
MGNFLSLDEFPNNMNGNWKILQWVCGRTSILTEDNYGYHSHESAAILIEILISMSWVASSYLHPSKTKISVCYGGWHSLYGWVADHDVLLQPCLPSHSHIML